MRIVLRALKTRAAAALTVGLLSLAPTAVFTTEAHATVSGSACLSDLPSQAWDTLDLIDADGPFPYSQDGVVFQNRERVLPAKSSGYYHEYTVITPNSPTRGARRIITGKVYHEDYYTSDHYASFYKVDWSC
ncbi:ribonuclease domain-containing protein [Streptomyces sp. CB01881]|uniref:ribonuclease domain-containing protein n=1 Tax=Streptomyces sp. CB01881 TaxID=2078691 RepID=UPI000CDBF07E|nr:ribonuclease domain-containing protein [Streptomyces sp. CB01881]AUY53269.1 ribonuclease [Streptomyces sp. CB01881]TYC69428.1 ribonuclease [Streptomyces sp. CB01881]